MKLHADYYPVYKDISDMMEIRMRSGEEKYWPGSTGFSADKFYTDSCSPSSPEMLNANGLIEITHKIGFSVFQTVVLLLKNTFEGHVYLNFNLRPDRLFVQGTIRGQDKHELLIPGFYKHLEDYWTGLHHAWKLLKKEESGLDEICFESVVCGILTHQLIRFPVSLCMSTDIRKFSEVFAKNRSNICNHLDISMICERALGGYQLIKEVNDQYEEQFKELLQQLRLKEDILSHYDRKFAFALDPQIKTEAELDSCMYKYLVEHKLYSNSSVCRPTVASDSTNPTATEELALMRNKIKFLFRSISKNCYEVHTSFDPDSRNSELQEVFMEANAIYNDKAGGLAEAMLQYMRMVLLFSNVLIYRKLRGLNVIESVYIDNITGQKPMSISGEDIQMIRRSLDEKLANLQIICHTEFKTRYIANDDHVGFHKIYLLKQLDFMDEQIAIIQNNIKVVLDQKSQV